MNRFRLFPIFLAGLVVFCTSVTAQEVPIKRLAVVPFFYPADPDYGVFMADRVAFELYAHAYFPPLRRNRFELIESDTLEVALHKAVGQANRRVPDDVLEALKRRVPAAYLLTGSVISSGIKTWNLKLIDLETGTIVWQGAIRDNPAWLWTRNNRNVGEIPTEALRLALGFGSADTAPPPPKPDDLPGEVLLQPIYTTMYSELAADSGIRLREAVVRDGLFSIVPGEIKGRQGERFLPRLGVAQRREVAETTLADAALCGSLLMLGKDGTAHNVAMVLRLVESETGRILWMGSASGRRVWRWDKLADLLGEIMNRLTEDLAQYGAGAAESVVARLLEEASNGVGWCEVGEAYLHKGLLRQAEEAFQKALTFEDQRALAHNGLGLVFQRRSGAFAQAKRAFQTAIQENPEFLEAYCNLARVYLDRDMFDGVQYAQKALQKNPEFSLAYRVLGDWYFKHEDDPKASEHYRRYLSLEPDDVEVAIRLGRSLLRLKDFPVIDQLIKPILRARPEAADLMPVVAIRAFQGGNFRESSRLFDRFLSQAGQREKELYGDVRWVMSPQDLAPYEELTGRAREVFEDRFWREKDPDLSNAFNERKLEHFGRVWIARKDFGVLTYPWDQRGSVYIRYGEPDHRSRSGRITVLTSPRVQELKERVYTQLYQMPPDGELIGPVFPIRSDRGMSIAQDQELETMGSILPQQTPGTSRQTNVDILSRQRMDQEAYAPVTMQSDRSIVPWESWVYTEVDGGLIIDFTKELGGVSGFDFAPLPAIPPSNLRSSIRLVEYAPEVAFERAVSNRSDFFVPKVPQSLADFHYDLADFRSDNRKSRVDVMYSIPISALLTVTDGKRPRVILERGVALADSAFAIVYRQVKKVELEVDEDSGNGHVVDLVRSDVPPGLYHMTLTVKDVMSGKQGILKRDVRVEAYGQEKLQISDLLMAKQLNDTVKDIRFRRGAQEVVPNPERRVEAPHHLALYYEVYNLQKDSFGQTRYRVTTAVKDVEEAQGVRRAFGPVEQPEVSLAFEQVGDRIWERISLEVDLSKVVHGQNRLLVVLEDLISGQKVAKETLFFYQGTGY